MNQKQRIEELVRILNQASEAYYNGMDEIMSNYEWDAMFDELTALEEETGHILRNSPTQTAGYESENGKREEHEFSALSLAKTKKAVCARNNRRTKPLLPLPPSKREFLPTFSFFEPYFSCPQKRTFF